MKKLGVWALLAGLVISIAGCAKKTASEQLGDDMKKMQSDMNKAAKKLSDDMR